MSLLQHLDGVKRAVDSPPEEFCPRNHKNGAGRLTAYGYGGTSRWCGKCQAWRPCRYNPPSDPRERYADVMGM